MGSLYRPRPGAWEGPIRGDDHFQEVWSGGPREVVAWPRPGAAPRRRRGPRRSSYVRRSRLRWPSGCRARRRTSGPRRRGRRARTGDRVLLIASAGRGGVARSCGDDAARWAALLGGRAERALRRAQAASGARVSRRRRGAGAGARADGLLADRGGGTGAAGLDRRAVVVAPDPARGDRARAGRRHRRRRGPGRQPCRDAVGDRRARRAQPRVGGASTRPSPPGAPPRDGPRPGPPPDRRPREWLDETEGRLRRGD